MFFSFNAAPQSSALKFFLALYLVLPLLATAAGSDSEEEPTGSALPPSRQEERTRAWVQRQTKAREFFNSADRIAGTELDEEINRKVNEEIDRVMLEMFNEKGEKRGHESPRPSSRESLGSDKGDTPTYHRTDCGTYHDFFSWPWSSPDYTAPGTKLPGTRIGRGYQHTRPAAASTAPKAVDEFELVPAPAAGSFTPAPAPAPAQPKSTEPPFTILEILKRNREDGLYVNPALEKVERQLADQGAQQYPPSTKKGSPPPDEESDEELVGPPPSGSREGSEQGSDHDDSDDDSNASSSAPGNSEMDEDEQPSPAPAASHSLPQQQAQEESPPTLEKNFGASSS